VTSECRVLRAEATIATITICRQTAPTLALQGNVQQSYETSPLQLRTFNASLIGTDGADLSGRGGNAIACSRVAS
jgi:hypothetical protein